MVFTNVDTIRGKILPNDYYFVLIHNATYGELPLNPCILPLVKTKLEENCNLCLFIHIATMILKKCILLPSF